MVLIKCKCGCFFTKDELNVGPWPVCQNCRTTIQLNPADNQWQLRDELSAAGASISVIPKNARISITFDV